jgi:polysaccharide deacetylase 2 family uncharacterized protein YibQ
MSSSYTIRFSPHGKEEGCKIVSPKIFIDDNEQPAAVLKNVTAGKGDEKTDP